MILDLWNRGPLREGEPGDGGNGGGGDPPGPRDRTGRPA